MRALGCCHLSLFGDFDRCRLVVVAGVEVVDDSDRLGCLACACLEQVSALASLGLDLSVVMGI